MTWRVLGMTSDERGMTVGLLRGGFHATCGHSHDSRELAEACPWEPVDPPRLYAGLVAQVRADDSNTPWRQGQLFQ